ncbi:hypothetical protein NQZ68_012668 [Dissostichus eleginoides]|nr:hypothetical protein NQZ68_012668 [Dissostichus eleginoides]
MPSGVVLPGPPGCDSSLKHCLLLLRTDAFLLRHSSSSSGVSKRTSSPLRFQIFPLLSPLLTNPPPHFPRSPSPLPGGFVRLLRRERAQLSAAGRRRGTHHSG